MAKVPSTLIQQIQDALRVSTSLIAITSSDLGQTLAALSEFLADKNRPLVQWDGVRGFQGLNKSGVQEIMKQMPKADAFGEAPNLVALTSNAVDALRIMQDFGDRTITFMLNLQLDLDGRGVQQAIWNLRDSNKEKYRAMIMLTPPGLSLPPTLSQDVLMLDDPLPTTDQILKIIDGNVSAYNQALEKSGKPKLKEFEKDVKDRIASAAVGLSAYTADQAIAMNLTEKGVNIPGVWARKTSMISMIKGLTNHLGNERYENYIGNQNGKDMFDGFINGNWDRRAIVLFDEIDKDFAGNRGDNTGVSQEFHGALLSLIEDLEIPCILGYGVWGVGKTLLAKAARNHARGGSIPLLKASLSQMKSGIVGSSMGNFKSATNVVLGVSDYRPLFYFTCNSMEPLSPEFKSRMKIKLFFDLPGDAERPDLWATYRKQYNLPEQDLPEDKNWAGRDIKQCCEMAWALNIKIVNAAGAIVPQAIASADKLAAIRREASGSLISADKPGIYHYSDMANMAKVAGRGFEAA